MNTLQINACLKRCSSFRGTFPIDKMPPLDTQPYSCVLNLSPSGHAGTHWIALFSKDGKMVEYFDSYGRDIPMEIREKIGQRHTVTNGITLQQVGSNVCGQYCIYFVWNRDKGRSLKSIVADFSRTSQKKNDSKVKQWVHKKFCFVKVGRGRQLQICKAMEP